MTRLHAHAHYTCIVCAKYRKASIKALLQVDFLMYALSKHKHNTYLIGNIIRPVAGQESSPAIALFLYEAF